MAGSRVLFLCTLLSAAGAAVYANTFSVPFIFDDALAIGQNSSIRQLWPLTTVLFSATFASVAGRPILNLSLAINYALGGTDVWGYHLVNLLFHVAAGLLLFGIIRHTLYLPSLRKRYSLGADWVAFTIALIWLVHPLQTESVTYIIQRSEAMVGVFFLLTLYCLLRGHKSSHKSLWYSGAVSSCLLGMGTKEVMVTAPAVVLLYDWIFLSGSPQKAIRSRPAFYAGLASTWLVLAALMGSSGQREGSAGFGLGMTAWEYARSQLVFIIHYLRLCFWPDPLVLDYGVNPVTSTTLIALCASAVLMMVGLTVWALIRYPKIGFLCFCFFVILAPTSSIVPLPGQIAAERRMYLPLAAVISLGVLSFHAISHHAATRLSISLIHFQRAAAISLIGVVPMLGYRTMLRNQEYQNPLKIWQGVVDAVPDNPRGHLSVGAVLFETGQEAESVPHFSRAIQLEPRYATAYFNRATARHRLGDLAGAMEDFTSAIRINPLDGAVLAGRAAVYQSLQQFDEAIRDYDAAIAFTPLSAQPYYNRGILHFRLGNNQQAIEDYSNAIRLRSDYVDAYINRALAYQASRNVSAAIDDLTTAIQLRPKYAIAHGNRGAAYLLAGRYREAIEDVTNSISLDAGRPGPYIHRAMAYFYVGDFDNAWLDVSKGRALGGEVDPRFVQDLVQRSGRSQ